ncbi:MAG: hypothetical protein Q9190_004054 [Brigantiaea leucoxantha]
MMQDVSKKPQQSASLLTLPNELLIQIIESGDLYFDPLLHLSLSCKHLCILAAPALKRHAEIKRKYSFIGVGDLHGSGSGTLSYRKKATHPTLALRDVFLTEAAAFSTTHLAIGNAHGHHADDWSDLFDDDTLEEVDTAAIQMHSLAWKRFQQSRYRNESGSAALDDFLRDRGKIATYALLVACLPNIRRLDLLDCGNLATSARKYSSLLKAAARRPIQLGMPVPSNSLLAEVNIQDTNPDSATGLDFLCPFASIPSVRKISGLRIADFPYLMTPNPPQMAYSSVEDLELWQSTVYPANLIPLLSHMKNLRRFTYHCQTISQMASAITLLRATVQYIPEQVARTLEYLRLEKCAMSSTSPAPSSSEDLSFLKAFARFQKLHDLRIDSAMLECQDLATSNWRFVDFLPASIKHLELLNGGNLTSEEIGRWLTDLPKQRSQAVPLLKSIAFNGVQTSFSETIIRECRDVGIEIHF